MALILETTTLHVYSSFSLTISEFEQEFHYVAEKSLPAKAFLYWHKLVMRFFFN